MAFSLFGTIDNPLKEISNNGYEDLAGGGMLLFLSNVVKFISVAAGLFAFINIILAGFAYVSAGSDTKKTTEAWAKIYMSLIGLIIIVASFAIAGIAGKILFGEWNAILQPQIYGPGATSGVTP
jgi:hypothetical protein